MIPEERISIIENAIMENRLADAFDQALAEPGSHFSSRYKGLKSRYTRIEQQRLSNTISAEQYGLETARITDTFLNYLRSESSPVYKLPLGMLFSSKLFLPGLLFFIILTGSGLTFLWWANQPTFPATFTATLYNGEKVPISNAMLSITRDKMILNESVPTDDKGRFFIEVSQELYPNDQLNILSEDCSGPPIIIPLGNLQPLSNPDSKLPTYVIYTDC